MPSASRHISKLQAAACAPIRSFAWAMMGNEGADSPAGTSRGQTANEVLSRLRPSATRDAMRGALVPEEVPTDGRNSSPPLAGVGQCGPWRHAAHAVQRGVTTT